MGYELYREIADYAAGDWTSGMLVVALMIADDANDQTRRSWIDIELLCHRAKMKPSGVKAALQKLAARGLEFRVAHGTDSIGRPVFAVTGHSTDYLVPTLDELIGDATASPNPVDNPPERGCHSIAFLTGQGEATASQGEATASQGEATASPLSSSPLNIPSITNGDLDFRAGVESAHAPDSQDPEPEFQRRRHMTELERQAWQAIGAPQ